MRVARKVVFLSNCFAPKWPPNSHLTHFVPDDGGTCSFETLVSTYKIFKTLSQPQDCSVKTQNTYRINDVIKRLRSRDSVVGIATGYGLDDRGIGVPVPVGSRIFSSPRRPDRLWGPPNLLSNGYREGAFPGGKAAGAWSWPLQLVLRSRKYGSIHLLPPYAFMT
jgi:hypothetical protein